MSTQTATDQIVHSLHLKKTAEITSDELALAANRVRQNIVKMVHAANSGHPGGALGIADILTVIYLRFLEIDPEHPGKKERNRFLLSNGHACAGLYSAMSVAGLIPESELLTFRKLGSRLQGHPSTKYLSLLENSSGSLGQGLSQAAGVALGLRKQGIGARVFAGISDGECQEGMTWEAAMSAAHYGLDNLTVYLDYNHIQIDGRVEDVMNLGDLKAKFEAFGWEARSAAPDSIDSVIEAIEWGTQGKGKPRIVLFETTIGKGVSFMEGQAGWHGKAPSDEELAKALEDLGAQEKEILARIG